MKTKLLNLFCLLIISAFQAQTLDTSFGVNGIFLTDFQAVTGVTKMEIRQDNSIYALSRGTFFKIDNDGNYVTTFSSDGKVSIPNSDGSFSTTSFSVTPDDKTYLLLSKFGTVAGYTGGTKWYSQIKRLNANGSDDLNFGNSGIHTKSYNTSDLDEPIDILTFDDGSFSSLIEISPVNAKNYYYNASSNTYSEYDYPYASIFTTLKIGNDIYTGGYYFDNSSKNQFARLYKNGDLLYSSHLGNGSEGVKALATDGENVYFTHEYYSATASTQVRYLRKYNIANDEIDITYGANNGASFIEDSNIAADPNSDAVFMAYRSGTSVIVQKILSNGDLDTNFGISGEHIVDLGSTVNAITDIEFDSNEKLVISGETVDGTLGDIGFILRLQDITLSTNDFEFQNALTVFPNPVEDKVIIDTNNSLRLVGYRITSMEGKIVKEAKMLSNEIDTKKLEPGMYLLNIMTNQGIVTKKIVKK